MSEEEIDELCHQILGRPKETALYASDVIKLGERLISIGMSAQEQFGEDWRVLTLRRGTA